MILHTLSGEDRPHSALCAHGAQFLSTRLVSADRPVGGRFLAEFAGPLPPSAADVVYHARLLQLTQHARLGAAGTIIPDLVDSLYIYPKLRVAKNRIARIIPPTNALSIRVSHGCWMKLQEVEFEWFGSHRIQNHNSDAITNRA